MVGDWTCFYSFCLSPVGVQCMNLGPISEAKAKSPHMLSCDSGQASPSECHCHVSMLHIILPGHFAAEDVKAKLSELNQKWEALKAKASQRRQDLEDSLQAQQYFADANEAESWMREKEPIVGSTDYGKDEDSAEVAQTWASHGLGKWAQP